MGNRTKNTKQSTTWSEYSTPLLMLATFALGAGGMWAIMRASGPGPSERPAMKSLDTDDTLRRVFNGQNQGSMVASTPDTAEPPDVSQLPPADAARTSADWNYDRRNWPHAIDHYQEALARGADNADVRTDLGNCFRFTGQPQKALEQYQIAQTQNPRHENSLFNQISLYAEVLHDNQRALTVAHEFITRFPQSSQAQSARQLMSHIQKETGNP